MTNELFDRCEQWFAAYMHDRESYDEATRLLAALRSRDAAEPNATTPTYEQLVGTLRVVAGLINDALPTAEGTSAEALAHAYESIETTLHGVAAEPAEPQAEGTPVYDADFAIHIAQCWRADKMIGGDEDAVRNALLAEVERLRAERREPSHE